MLLQAYVIATSTLVDISKVDVSKFDDSYFKASDKAEKKKGEDGFFETQTEKKELGSEYIENQKKVLLLSPNIYSAIACQSCCKALHSAFVHSYLTYCMLLCYKAYCQGLLYDWLHALAVDKCCIDARYPCV